MTYGKELKKRLKKHGLTQAKFAEEIGVTQALISQYALNKLHPTEQKKLLIDSYFYLLETIESDKIAQKESNEKATKHDTGKHRLSLVPTQGILDVADVREYGLQKYGGSESWRTVDPVRYVDALYRHLLAMVDDMHSKDDESGIEHYKHVACNAMFLCELLKKCTNCKPEKMCGSCVEKLDKKLVEKVWNK